MKTLLLDRVSSPIGSILILSDGEALCGVEFEEYEARTLALLSRRYGSVELRETKNPLGLRDRIEAYLAGEFHSLDEVTVSLGGTAFQQQVWLALRDIPIGTVETYGQLAKRLDKPGASRAVGLANSQNPIAIVLPCHRVIGSNGKLTGYAGGLDRKRWLLMHEGVPLPK